MALVDNAWYVNSITYGTVTAWVAATVYAAGAVRRQSATPAVNSERCFVCIVAGTSHATTEPTWTLTRGAKTTDNTVTWQECTGVAAINGDLTNTPTWTITATPPGGVKNTAVTLGQVIKRDSGASYQICSTAGTAGNGAEPAFSNTAGVTTADNTATWTSLGVVGNFTGWQYPHARLFNAVTSTWGAAGDNFYLASEHAETQATASSLALVGNFGTPSNYLSVTKTTVPPVSANLTVGASIATTGANNIAITGGYATLVGITIKAGDGANAASIQESSSGVGLYLKNCSLVLNNTSTSSRISLPSNSNSVNFRCTLDNTTITFGATTQAIIVGGASNGTLNWINTPSALGGATFPATLFLACNGMTTIDGVDLSALGARTIFATSTSFGTAILKNCKLHASTVIAPSITNYNERIAVISSDSTTTNYRHELYTGTGIQTVETTIVRTGGATNGTTPISWKIVTTTNIKLAFPFESLPIAIWNDTTATTRTITLYGIWGGGAVPTNADIWFELNYMGSTLTPVSTFATCGVADILAAGTNLTTDTSTWGGSTTKFKMSVTLSSPQPNMKGPIYLTVKAAKASSTFYIDPKPVIT